MYRKIIITVLSLVFAVASVLAQTTLVRGVVVDSHDGEPLIQAHVAEINADNRTVSSTVTNIDGQFSINVKDTKNKLQITYIGYKAQEVKITVGTEIKIRLMSNEEALKEVVITARPKAQVGNLAIDERDVSMSIAKLSAADIADLNVASVDEALQGRMAGVDIMANAGDPGSGMSIRIRGVTSLNGNNKPLIVVDGIPLETSIGADFDFATATEEEFSQLLNVAPADIKEIVVLKDAAATAIYGSKAANGVLQITTQRGTISPPKITFKTSVAMQPTPKAVPMLSGDEYSTLILEGYRNGGKELDLQQRPEFAYDPLNPYYYYNYRNNTDWVGAVSQTGYTQSYDLSVRGGSQKVRYSFSAGYYNQIGNTIETGLERITTRLNLDYFVSDKLRFSADIAYTHSDNQRNLMPNGDDKSDVRAVAYTKMPNQSIYEYNERGELTPLFFMPESGPQGQFPDTYNPVALARMGDYNIISEKIIPKLQIQFMPNSVWRYQFDVGFDVGYNKTKSFLANSATNVNLWSTYYNQARDANDESFVIQTLNKLFFTPKFADENKHRLIALLGVSTYQKDGYSFSDMSYGSPSDYLNDPINGTLMIDNAKQYGLHSSSVQQRNISTYLNVNYTLFDRYTVFGNLAYNGDSRFGDSYRFGLFPAISGRWRVSGEPWLAALKGNWLDDFSLRASWGMTGNPPKNDYMYYDNYTTYAYNYLGEAATAPSSLRLRQLRWEKSFQNNYGLNLIAFKDKLNVEFDYYIKNTQDQINTATAIPTSSGFSSMGMNYGTIRNQGWELSVNIVAVQSKDWKVNLAFNVAREENMITQLSEYANTGNYFSGWNANGTYLTQIVEGVPYGSFYGYRYDGVYLNKDQTIARDEKGNKIYLNNKPQYMIFGYPTVGYVFQPGDARYKDMNHDGNINLGDVEQLGDYNPLFFGGLTPTVKYKNWQLNTVFFFRYGNDLINAARMNMEKMSSFDNQAKSVLRRWRHEYAPGAEADNAPTDLLPRAVMGTIAYNWLASDRFVEDGSFLRWKSFTLRYNFARSLLNKLQLQEAYIYFTMQNVLILTNYTGQDPEVAIGKQDNARAPIPKYYTLGLSVSF